MVEPHRVSISATHVEVVELDEEVPSKWFVIAPTDYPATAESRYTIPMDTLMEDERGYVRIGTKMIIDECYFDGKHRLCLYFAGDESLQWIYDAENKWGFDEESR